ncbi:MAG: 30S ribosomal protein S15 [Candidatus Muirbacterium halophilum]|nr:30S ribosomal protein S15 [Candidatus Muirbacterium halophilum]MCK9474465.1 30S ribosomal protein S15 [Candidatus Muirbacterium halophilum]
MSITKEQKTKITEEFRMHEKDTGSAEVQVAILTKRIENLRPHFATHKKDNHSKKGLIRLVNNRKKHLRYLKTKNYEKYLEIVSKLGLRK